MMLDTRPYVTIRDIDTQISIPNWWGELVDRLFDKHEFKTYDGFNNYIKDAYGATYYVTSPNAYLLFDTEEDKLEFILKIVR
jgi:hypothetical protein